MQESERIIHQGDRAREPCRLPEAIPDNLDYRLALIAKHRLGTPPAGTGRQIGGTQAEGA
eukprot:644701-Pelagomonas_calceolata.AAC.1